MDDDQITIELYTKLLCDAGYQVSSSTSSIDAIAQIVNLRPDCVISDLTMPEIDGVDLFQKVRDALNVKPAFVIITNKVFEFDRRRALSTGVDGYLTKPIDPKTFVDDLLKIVSSEMTVQFWGVRGTLPVPGKETIRYGGNTNCVTVAVGNKHFFIFDAGTGIKELSNYLVKQNKFPMSAKVFITHPHYDHINGIPFFVPFYMKGNEFEIFGPSHGEFGIDKLVSGQMDSVYFPITIKEFSAALTFHTLTEEEIIIDDFHVQTLLLNHPGRCLGYRLNYKNKSFCYVTDNELYSDGSTHGNVFEEERLVQFVKDADMLIMDTTYDEEYFKKVGWGHSSVERVVDVAHKANVKLLCLFHHDPDQFDEDIDLKLKHAQDLLKQRGSSTVCIAPHEGQQIII